MRKLSFLLVAIVMIMSCFVVVGCGEKKDENKLEVIKLNEVTHSIFYAPLYVAINNGYFEDEGIKIELTNGGGADKSMTAILSGAADVGLMGPEASLYVCAGDSDNKPTVFGQLTKRDGSFILAKEDIENFTLEDMIGKEIIGGRKGGMPAMTLQYTIENAGYEIGKGTNQINLRDDVDFNMTASVFDSTDADFCTLFEPTASDFADANDYYVVESVGMLAGEVPYTCFMANQDWLKNNNTTAFNFLKAVYRGYKFLNYAEMDEIIEAIAPSFTTFSKTSIEKSINSYIASDAWCSTPVMNEDAFDMLVNIIENADVLENKVEFTDMVDNTIAQKVVDYFM